MSFMETLLIDKFEVPCQTDPEYKISSNQCSWCAVLFGINYKELLKAYLNDKAEFIKLYKKYLNDSTLMRKEYGQPLYGENIDNKILKEKTELTNRIFKEANFELNPKKSQEFLKLLPDDLKNEFYTKKYININDFSFLLSYKFTLISRHGQSFVIIPYGNHFLVLDSHAHHIGLMTYDNTVKYIKYQNSENLIDGYLFITILCCA
jgi:hypothetical protein